MARKKNNNGKKASGSSTDSSNNSNNNNYKHNSNRGDTNHNNSNKKGGKKKTGRGRLAVSVVLFVVLVFGYAVSLGWQDDIDNALGLRKVEYYSAGDLVSIGSMNIHFIDVGQGDSCLIELPDGKTALIDAGENNNEVQDKLKSYIEKVNDNRAELDSPALPRPEIKYFDYVIATHSDSDHVGSLAYILGLYPAATFYRPNEEATNGGYTDPAADIALPSKNRFWGDKHGKKDTLTYKNAVAAGYKSHDNFVEGIVINPYSTDTNCINPAFDSDDAHYYEINLYGPIKSHYANYNNYSPIIIAEYQGRRVALSGDSESEGEADFVAAIDSAGQGDHFYPLKNKNFYVDILKLGHHGSSTSSTADYLAIMTNQSRIGEIYAVISCGFENSYNHPHDVVLDRISALGIREENILSTGVSAGLENDIFFAFNYYEGISTALVERTEAGDREIITYLHEYFGIKIRYSVLAFALLILVLVTLLIINYNAIKKHIPKAKKAIKKNSRKW